MSDLAAIILAAGKGTRMRSDLPKVFHEILGEPMLSYVIKTVQTLKPAKILVVAGHQRQLIMDYYNDWPGIEFVVTVGHRPCRFAGGTGTEKFRR
jgi:bifunctional UDP-N-acetylglucosamine pyrophosphorylase / glucosamine-1-phosphate N-acetyltransferase